MKVLYVPDVVEYGGAFNSFCEMVLTLKNEYLVEPIIVCSKKGKYYEFAEKNGIKAFVLGYKAFMIGKGSTLIKKIIKFLLFPFIKIQYYVCENKALKLANKNIDFSAVDIVHSNINRNSIGMRLAKKYGIRHIWHIREFGDLDYDCISLVRNYIKMMNDSDSKYISVSKSVKNHWVNKGLIADNVYPIYNGVNMSDYSLKISNHSNNGIISMIFVGEMIQNKGQLDFIKGLNQLDINEKKRIRLDIYGGGSPSYIKKINKYLRKNKLDTIIRINGFSNNVADLLPKYDVGVMGSFSEGFGRVTIEYMSAGLCVLATKSGANIEIVNDKENGILYEWGNTKSVVESVRFLLNNDFSYIQKKAYEYSRSNFTKANNANNIFKLYEKLLRGE